MAASPAATAWLRQETSGRAAGPAARAAGPAALGAVADGLAGYRGLGRAGTDLNAHGVRFLRLGHHDPQNAVLRRGLDLVRLHMAGHGDRPAEGAVAALGPVDLLTGGAARWVPLALDRQQAVLELDLQVLGRDTGQFGGHHVGVLALEDVDRGSPWLGGGPSARLIGELPGQPGHPQQFVLAAAKITE